MIGSSSADIRKSVEIQINAGSYEGLELSRHVPAVTALDYIGVTYCADKQQQEYALIEDWQSRISYEYCRMRSYHTVEVVVSNPGAPTKLTFTTSENGNVVAEVSVPATGSMTEFVTVTAPAEPIDGVFTLNCTAGGMLSLRSFCFK